MKLSIIIISYNEVEYISEAIDSCLNQTFDYEIIIIDDGSDDGSIELIKEYARRYPSIIKYHVMDRSDVKDIKDIIISERVSNNIKKAFTLCSGEYITLLAGDDKNIALNRYQKQVEFLDKNPKYISCYTDFEMFWNDGRVEKHKIGPFFTNQLCWATRYIHVSCFVFKRNCIEHIPDRFCDDDGMVYTILSRGKTKYLAIDGFAYRQREKSIMSSQSWLEFKYLQGLLVQDLLNCGKMKGATLTRYLEPIKYMKANKEDFLAMKNKKFLDFASKYPNNIIKAIVEDSPVIDKYILYGRIYRSVCKRLLKLNKYFYKIIKN